MELFFIFGVYPIMFFLCALLFLVLELYLFYQKKYEFQQNKLLFYTLQGVATLGVFYSFLSEKNGFIDLGFSIYFLIPVIWFSCYDIYLYKHNKNYVMWWQKLSISNYLVYGFALLIFSMLGYYIGGNFSKFLMLLMPISFILFCFFIKRMNDLRKFDIYPNLLCKIPHFILYYSLKICQFILMLFLIYVALNPILDPLGIDTCLDTGYCKEGTVLDGCEGDKPCVITKEYCLKNNNVWYDENKSCDTRTSTLIKK